MLHWRLHIIATAGFTKRQDSQLANLNTAKSQHNHSRIQINVSVSEISSNYDNVPEQLLQTNTVNTEHGIANQTACQNPDSHVKINSDNLFSKGAIWVLLF